MPILSKPRYEARLLPERVPGFTHGVFDTFGQEFVLGEQCKDARSAAIRALQMSTAYERAMTA